VAPEALFVLEINDLRLSFELINVSRRIWRCHAIENLRVKCLPMQI